MEVMNPVAAENGNPNNAPNGVQTVEPRSYINDHHTQLDFTCLGEVYGNRLLSDVVLVAEGREIPAHKLILALSSTTFYWNFSNDTSFREADRIVIENVSYDTLSAIVSYLYNSKILISIENVEELLAVADTYVLNDLKKACCDFLKDNISLRLCIKTVKLAKRFRCQDLFEIAIDYIVAHFSEVIVQVDFREMTTDELIDVISHRALNTSQVLECVIEWVRYNPRQRKNRVHALMRHVRFTTKPRMDILQRLVQEQWFVSNPGYYSILVRMIASDALERQSQLSAEPSQSQFLVVAGYLGGGQISIELYDIQRNIWLDWPEGLRIRSEGLFAIVTRGSNIYYITTKKLRSMDIKNNLVWSDCSQLLEVREDPSMIFMNNSIFVIGGKDRQNCFLSSGERFDVISLEKTTIARLPELQHSMGLGVLNGTLFSVGGKSYSNYVHNKVKCYKPDTNTWYSMPNMSISRCESGVAALEDKLYVVGGLSNQGSCNQVEMFNPAEFSWTRLPDMNIAREAPGVIAVNSKLYVIGGFNKDFSQSLDSIEVYDPKLNTWSMLTSSMKIAKYYVSVSFINFEDINFLRR